MIGREGQRRVEQWVDTVLAESDLDAKAAGEARDDFVGHILDAAEARVAVGASSDEAVRAAIDDFGSPGELRTRLRAWGRASSGPLDPTATIPWRSRVESWLHDLRVSVRAVVKRPLSPIVVVSTVAVGVASTTTVLSVVETILVDPLPYPDPDALVVLADEAGDFGVTSPAHFLDIRDQTRSVFGGLAAYAPTTVVAAVESAVGSSVERVDADLVSADFFDVLNVLPALGRGFDPVHESGDLPVAVVSHTFWQRELGARSTLPISIVVDGVDTEVVGVMPPGFRLHREVDVWLPLELVPGEASRGANYLFVVGRLAEGQEVTTAGAAMEVVAGRLHAEYPSFFGDGPLPVRGLHETIVAGVASRLKLTALAVFLVLILVCGNVGTLLFARADDRAPELAVRRSVGASHGRVLQLVVADAALLLGTGAALGLALTWQAIAALAALAPRGLPRIEELSPDLGVLAIGLAATVGAGVIVAVPVALRVVRVGGSARVARPSGSRVLGGEGWRRGLVVAQIAGSAVLMIYAGLLVQSLSSLRAVDPGFDPDRLLTAQVSLSGERFSDAADRWRYFEALRDRLESEPGVETVAVGTFRPTSGGFTRRFALSDRPPPPDDDYLFATYDPVAPGYFETLGIRRTAGRTFEAADAADGRGVAVVNEAFVETFFPDGSPLGVRLGYYVDGEPRSDQFEIVGVVGNVRSDALAAETRPAIHIPLSVSPMPSGTLFVRARQDDPGLSDRVREAFLDVDGSQPAYSVRPMSEVYARSIERDRLMTMLLTVFAFVALSLAASGIFGLTAHGVGRRTREFGLRIAVGADPREILVGTIRDGLATALLGIALGSVGAALSSGLAGDALFGIAPRDPTTYVAVAIALTVVTVAAVAVPARRASIIHPLEALRHD